MDYEKKYKSLVAKVKKAHQFAQTDSTKNVLEDILPELRESEDERMRKAALAGIEYLEREIGWDAIDDIDILDVKEYLEKQKELPFVKDVMLGYPGLYFYDGERMHFRGPAMEEKQKEQKPEIKYIYPAFKVGDTIKPKAYNESHLIIKIKDDNYVLDNGFIFPIVGQDVWEIVEQKPTDYCSVRDKFDLDGNLKELSYDSRIQYDSVKSGIEAFASTYSFNIESKLFPQLTKEQQQLWREEIEQAVIAGGENGVELTRDNRYKENRTVEWSNEDKSFYDSIMCEVVKEGMHPTPAQLNWLKLLPERFNHQPKQEWNEEEKTIIEGACNALEVYGHSKLAEKLKSLRPQPHKEIYQAAKHDLAIKFMNYLDENRPEGKMSLSNGECEDIDKAFGENDWAKIMRYVEKYRPSWKPARSR